MVRLCSITTVNLTRWWQTLTRTIWAEVAPDLIIYGALTFAADYYLDERAQVFESKFQTFLAELQEQANDQELNGGIQAIQPSATYTDYQ